MLIKHHDVVACAGRYRVAEKYESMIEIDQQALRWMVLGCTCFDLA
jgi:hypothetical protein